MLKRKNGTDEHANMADAYIIKSVNDLKTDSEKTQPR
jgi:hypothetical protein